MRHPDFEKGVCESHTTKSLKADVGVSTSYVVSEYSYWYECVSVELVRRVILVDLLRMLILKTAGAVSISALRSGGGFAAF